VILAGIVRQAEATIIIRTRWWRGATYSARRYLVPGEQPPAEALLYGVMLLQKRSGHRNHRTLSFETDDGRLDALGRRLYSAAAGRCGSNTGRVQPAHGGGAGEKIVESCVFLRESRCRIVSPSM